MICCDWRGPDLSQMLKGFEMTCEQVRLVVCCVGGIVRYIVMLRRVEMTTDELWLMVWCAEVWRGAMYCGVVLLCAVVWNGMILYYMIWCCAAGGRAGQ